MFPDKFKKFHQERREAYVKRQGEGRLWIPSDIMDRARLESVLTKDGELQQVCVRGVRVAVFARLFDACSCAAQALSWHRQQSETYWRMRCVCYPSRRCSSR